KVKQQHNLSESRSQSKPFTFIHRNGLYEANLDRCYASADIAAFVREFKLYDPKLSDHKPQYIRVQTSEVKQSKGYWKMNTSVLEHPSFQQQISQLIEDFQSSEQNIVEQWQTFKLNVK